jgi:V/A-type H+-transporting ATPase subunit B
MKDQEGYGGQEVAGAARVEGPIVVIEGVNGVGYDEVVEVIDAQGRVRRGRVLRSARTLQ